MRVCRVLALILSLVPLTAVRAQWGGGDLTSAKQEVSKLWNLDAMMTQAANNIAKRYNMNEYQRRKTQELLVRDVTKFLNTHDDIWPLVRDLSRFQMKGQSPEGEVAKRIGQSAKPLMNDIREAILAGNAEWRELLTDEQKKMHDWDLQDIERTVGKMEANFSAMSDGVPVNQGMFPPPNTEVPQPAQPPRPRDDFRPSLDKPADAAAPTTEDFWDNYVQAFIHDFELDNAQSDAAFSILRECKDRARTYRRTREKEFADVRKRLEEAERSTADSDEKIQKIKDWSAANTRLNKPIVDTFEDLKRRLEPIPTNAQREKALAKGRLPRAGDRRLSSQRATQAPTSAPTSAPASAPAQQAGEPPAASQPAKPSQPAKASAQKR